MDRKKKGKEWTEEPGKMFEVQIPANIPAHLVLQASDWTFKTRSRILLTNETEDHVI